MTQIRIDGLRFARGGREILSIPSLEFAAARATAILGANGAGKTTLLRLVAGLDRPDAGRVLVGGHAADVRRNAVAYVFQENVFLRRSLLDNLTLGLHIRGASAPEARSRATQALALLGIENLAARRADRISGGEARRASLARALCLAAPVLLLDEPMAGLDGTAYAKLLEDLPSLLRAPGITTLLVTHDPGQAFRLCDDLVLLSDGRVVAAGTKQAIAADPQRADVAALLGYSVLELPGRSVASPPTALRLGPGPNQFAATVRSVLDLLHEWEIAVECGPRLVHVRAPRADAPPAPGNQVVLHTNVVYPLG